MLRLHGHSSSDFDGAELIFGALLGNVALALSFDLPSDPMRENGRGLYIIHKLAVSVEVEDVPNDGTRVIVELPIYKLHAVDDGAGAQTCDAS